MLGQPERERERWGVVHGQRNGLRKVTKQKTKLRKQKAREKERWRRRGADSNKK